MFCYGVAGLFLAVAAVLHSLLPLTLDHFFDALRVFSAKNVLFYAKKVALRCAQAFAVLFNCTNSDRNLYTKKRQLNAAVLGYESQVLFARFDFYGNSLCVC